MNMFFPALTDTDNSDCHMEPNFGHFFFGGGICFFTAPLIAFNSRMEDDGAG